MIQSDNAKIVSEANKVAGDEADPWRVAVALERYVHREVTEKSFSQAFATAADVAETREGDCSEHAVLLAAAGRVWGIPSRCVAGLVYLPQMQDASGQLLDNVMGYHMWTQFYLGGQWVDFDAALGESECSPTRLALMTSSLQETSMSELGLALLDLIGQITVEVDSVK